MDYWIDQTHHGKELRDGSKTLEYEHSSNTKLFEIINELLERLDKAIQLCDITSDWNINKVEIDGEMISVYELKEILNGAE